MGFLFKSEFTGDRKKANQKLTLSVMSLSDEKGYVIIFYFYLSFSLNPEMLGLTKKILFSGKVFGSFTKKRHFEQFYSFLLRQRYTWCLRENKGDLYVDQL